MNKKQRERLYEDYKKSCNQKDFEIALIQNRLLYSEIYEAYLISNGNKEVLEGGLDQLEIEAFRILPYIKLNPEES